MHTKEIITAGEPIKMAGKALVMVHGRGSTARNILGLAAELNLEDFAIWAPQATNNTWYPYSFLVPPAQNEPWLSSALDLLAELTNDIVDQGFSEKDIYFVGFSQGACLTLEFVTRHAKRYGGVVALTGGLIGDRIDPADYSGDFDQTPVLISSGDPDPHIPVQRIDETVAVLEEMNANVMVKVYEGRPHTISRDEIERANELIFGS